MEKSKNSLLCKNWYSHVFIDIQIQCTNSGGVLDFLMDCQYLNSESEILFVLSSITKKGEIESASRPLIDFGD
jgi:hypothetical protein